MHATCEPRQTEAAGAAPPRHFLGEPGSVPWMAELGMPPDRLARISARQCFIDAKQCFVEAVSVVPGTRGEWLRHQVRHAQEPVDLWLLRGAVFAALRDGADDGQRRRLDLHRALELVFPEHSELAPYLPL